MIFLFAGIILDMTQVFISLIFDFFNNLDGIDSSCQVAFLMILLGIFVFFRSLSLKLIYISWRRVLGGFILIFILMIDFVLVLLSWSIAFWKPKVDFLISEGGQRLVFISISTILFNTFSFEFKLRPQLFSYTQIERYSLLWKYRIKVFSLEAVVK